MENQKRLRFIQKIGYGLGDAGCNFCWTFVAAFILIYFTNVLGVSAAVVGTLMMISKVLDGITDVIMGSIIDRTRSKWGKARFWLLVSSLPTAVTVFLLFNVPASFTESTKYIYIFIIYTLMGAVFYTMNNIAYSTLSALATKDPKERVELGSYRFVFAIAAALIIMSVTSGLVESFGGGQIGWRKVSIIYSILCFVLMMVPVIMIRELPESELEEKEVKNEEPKEKLKLGKSFSLLFKNKYFLLILAYYLTSYLFNGIYSGLGIYYAMYNLGNAALLGALSMATLVPTILLLPVVPQLTGKFGLRTTSLIGMLIALAGGVVAFFGGALGVIPVLMGGAVVYSAGKAPMTGATNAMIAAADDYANLKFGQRMTGTIFSCSSVGMKVGTGVGTAVCGFILEWSKFDGQASTQSEQTLSMIQNSYLSTFILIPLTAVVILFFLNVEKVNRKLKEEVQIAENE